MKLAEYYIIPKTLITVFIFMVFIASDVLALDPWGDLQKKYNSKSETEKTQKKKTEEDPWAKLRAIYLPFTEDDEVSALTSTETAGKVAGYIQKAILPYEKEIKEASEKFNIPKEIIGAVIMVESGGNAKAKAKTSSAKGLMQTIKSTFKEARLSLESYGINIDSDPYNPHSSIMAGSWYLNRMFEKAQNDGKKGVNKRQEINSWRYPLEYYYAGPGNGVKPANIIIIYSGGKRVVIDKPAYSKKVMRWAKIMEKAQNEQQKDSNL